MPAASTTATTYQSPPRLVHTGVNVARGIFTATDGASGFCGTSKSHTASDRIWMVPVPANCIIVDGYLRGHIDNDASIFKIGAFGPTGTMSSTLATLITLSTTQQTKRFDQGGNAAGCPMTMSASDDQPVVYVGVECTTAGTNTNTASLVLVLFYVAKGQI